MPNFQVGYKQSVNGDWNEVTSTLSGQHWHYNLQANKEAWKAAAARSKGGDSALGKGNVELKPEKQLCPVIVFEKQMQTLEVCADVGVKRKRDFEGGIMTGMKKWATKDWYAYGVHKIMGLTFVSDVHDHVILHACSIFRRFFETKVCRDLSQIPEAWSIEKWIVCHAVACWLLASKMIDTASPPLQDLCDGLKNHVDQKIHTVDIIDAEKRVLFGEGGWFNVMTNNGFVEILFEMLDAGAKKFPEEKDLWKDSLMNYSLECLYWAAHDLELMSAPSFVIAAGALEIAFEHEKKDKTSFRMIRDSLVKSSADAKGSKASAHVESIDKWVKSVKDYFNKLKSDAGNKRRREV